MIKSWMIIGGIALLVGGVGSSIVPPSGIKWFKRIRRPRWLTFEKAIPILWTIVFICGAWSATIVWEKDPGSQQTWFLMAWYLLLELVTIAYNPLMLTTRRLKVGTIVGGIGVILGLLLALTVWRVSGWAALLLLPYLIWSPIGTYTTWEMSRLNPSDA